MAKFIEEDPRVQPSAIGLSSDEPEFRLLPQVGGVIVFSGAQLHATVSSPDSLSRYSVDFRTVSRRDVERGVGARNVDSRCTGTALRDFRRVRDGAVIPEELPDFWTPSARRRTRSRVRAGSLRGENRHATTLGCGAGDEPPASGRKAAARHDLLGQVPREQQQVARRIGPRRSGDNGNVTPGTHRPCLAGFLSPRTRCPARSDRNSSGSRGLAGAP